MARSSPARRIGIAAAAISATIGEPSAAGAQSTSCDRACLSELADTVTASIAAADASRLPLAPDYLATENLVASVPASMALWRPGTRITIGTRVIDPASGQILFVATVDESGRPALMHGRIRVAGVQIVELEIYVNRSQGQSGYMFDPRGTPIHDVPTPSRPTRAQLLAAARSMFDPAVAAPPAAPDCVVVETGSPAHLDASMQRAMTRAVPGTAPVNSAPERTTAVGCDAPAHRPADPHASVDLIDEVQGLAVSIGLVSGVVTPFLGRTPSSSTFLPDGYQARYRALQDKQRAALPKDATLIRMVPASAAVTQIYRLDAGHIVAFHRFIQVQPAHAVSPWASSPRRP